MTKLPSDILDLNNWYLTLPVGEPKDPIDVYNPQIQQYSHPKYFHVNDNDDAVVFSSFSGGATTRNSLNPRSELREMFGQTRARWSMLSGIHTMTIIGCTTILPRTRPSTVIGQIHRGGDDVIEVRCWKPRRSPSIVIDVFHNKTNYGILNPNYTLGDKYEIKLVASNGIIHVFYEDIQTPKLNIPSRYETCFFKAGSYIQCNPTSHSAPMDDFTESWLYSLKVEHGEHEML